MSQTPQTSIGAHFWATELGKRGQILLPYIEIIKRLERFRAAQSRSTHLAALSELRAEIWARLGWTAFGSEPSWWQHYWEAKLEKASLCRVHDIDSIVAPTNLTPT